MRCQRGVLRQIPIKLLPRLLETVDTGYVAAVPMVIVVPLNLAEMIRLTVKP
jgi:hypothetical protein